MEIGVMLNVADKAGLGGIVDQVRSVAAAGLRSAWLPQIFGIDALTALAVAGREVPDITLGTAVVPTWPRHPTVLAGQALTTQAATGGRLVLGIGLSHQLVIEGMMGIPFQRPALHMREYLTVLRALVHEGTVDFTGETLRTATMIPFRVPDAEPFPILVAALGPAMLRLAGELSEGTLTWMAGRSVVEGRMVPSITEAAAAAGRPAPQVLVGLPVSVTAYVDQARERAARQFVTYGLLPSYRRLLDEEKVDGPADVAIVGDEESVAAQIRGFLDAGATGFLASPFGSAPEREATLRLMGQMAQG
ncbi:MAG: LLM class F420-dependent oxidoreductase [Acidimicrobiia bacterium]